MCRRMLAGRIFRPFSPDLRLGQLWHIWLRAPGRLVTAAGEVVRAAGDLTDEQLDQLIEQFAALAEAQEKQKQLEAAAPAAEQTVDVKP